jgi:LCP family protein required for cell wall assembly
MPAVMEDFEAYGQLRDRPRATQAAPGARQRATPLTGAQAPTPEVLAPPKKRRSHWLRNILLLVFGYLFVAVLTTVQPLPVPFTGMRVAAPFPGGAPVLFGLPNRPFTVVVIGLDRRPANDGPSRTDTILLLRIDPRDHEAAFLSIPRDSLMQVPVGDGYTQDRINSAFVYNWSPDDESAAPRAVMETIEHNLGIEVDHYVIFDQYSAKDLIDAMGGVTIDNPQEFGQADYSDDDVNVQPQHFAAGKLTLDGCEAVAYGRIREGSSDFDRIERQQRVGAALIDRASSPLSIFRLPGAYGAYRKTVKTDMSMRQSAGVLSLLKRVPDDKLQTKSLGEAAVSCSWCAASIQLLDPVKVQEIITEAFGDDAAGALAAEKLVGAGVTP